MKRVSNIKIVAALSVLAILIIDLIIPPGTAVGILYLVSMTLVLNEDKKTIILFAIISSLLIVMDILVHHIHHEIDLHYSVYGDRILSVSAIWLSCIVLLKYRRLNEEKTMRQEELMEQEKRYHRTIDNLIVGAQIINFDFKYLYVNEAAVRQSKFSREELIGYSMKEKYPGIENSDMFKGLEKAMTERIILVFENVFDFPDGSKGYFKLSCQPVSEGLFVLSMDISERRKREENNKQYITELEEMIFITSHKIRQPITHLLGLSNLLRETHNSEEELKKIAAYMEQSFLSLDNFTKELTAIIHTTKLKNRE